MKKVRTGIGRVSKKKILPNERGLAAFRFNLKRKSPDFVEKKAKLNLPFQFCCFHFRWLELDLGWGSRVFPARLLFLWSHLVRTTPPLHSVCQYWYRKPRQNGCDLKNKLEKNSLNQSVIIIILHIWHFWTVFVLKKLNCANPNGLRNK